MNQWHTVHEGASQDRGVRVALELVELIEQDNPLAETIALCLPLLSRVLAANDAVGLIMQPSRAPREPIPTQLSPVRDFTRWLSTTLAHAPAVTLAEQGSTRALVGQSEKDAFLQRIAALNCWAGAETESQLVLVLLQVPTLNLAHLVETQSTLQTLTTALCKRRFTAHQSRHRLKRAQTLATTLEEIATNRNVDHVLGTIVERARELLDADRAYLAEIDETARRVTMRATSGVPVDDDRGKTSQVEEILFEAVATTCDAVCTNDYVADHRFIHTPSVETNTKRDVLNGIIAAPLQFDNRVLGVLGVVDHGEFVCSSEKLQIIRGLAHGAAIALQNAHLSSNQSHVIRQLREEQTQTTTQHEAIKRSISIQDQLTELVLQGHPVEAIAHRLRQLLGNPVVVLGPFFNLLARAGLDATEARAVVALVASARVTPRFSADWAWMMTERKTIRLDHSTVFSTTPAQAVTPVIVGAEVVGYVVVVERDRSLDDLQFPTLKQAATVVAVELMRARLVAEVEHRLRGDFVHDLVSGRFDQDLILGRAKGLGHDLTAPQVLLALAPNAAATGSGTIPTHTPSTDYPRRIDGALRASLQQRELMAQISVVGEVVVVLIALAGHLQSPRDEAITLAQGIQRDLAVMMAPVNVSLGLSRVCWSMESIAQAYREALLAVKKGMRLDERGSLTSFEQLGVERVLLLAPEARDLQEYAESRLGNLLRYDRERGASLVATLEAYLDCGGRLRETARTVGIHVNSLDHRLRRIEQIGEISLADTDTRLDLALALRASRLARPSDRAHGSGVVGHS